ncbi:MAG TPA: SGNH/GDSL hydrolase family protein [Thermoanaerobaculia bacterium]|nr:SGNH/GDSL hydrolase family protein [Thermoanaerobaculia bacterium]
MAALRGLVVPSPPPFHRYVAIGDSSTEGLIDPDGVGGYRGWANRLAERIATVQGGLLYANLGIRGRRTRQILDLQLPRALALEPDLVTLFCGTNDVIGRRFEAAVVAADVEAMQRALVRAGATVLTFTLPDLAPVMPLAKRLAPRVRELNDALRATAAATGALLVDFEAFPIASDPRLWHEDRLHANALGHERIAAALAQALGLPGADGTWAEPLPALPAPTRVERLAAELAWMRRYLLPWLWRHFRGRSTGDGLAAKRPDLAPVTPCG